MIGPDILPVGMSCITVVSFQLIEQGIRDGKYPSNIMSMHNNFYWYRMLLEENSYGQPTAECSLTPLRAFIYRIVLPRHENLVEEWGRSPYEKLRKAGVN
jgi:hypothetical protein